MFEILGFPIYGWLTYTEWNELVLLDEFPFCRQVSCWFEDFRFWPRDWIVVNGVHVRHDFRALRQDVTSDLNILQCCMRNLQFFAIRLFFVQICQFIASWVANRDRVLAIRRLIGVTPEVDLYELN